MGGFPWIFTPEIICSELKILVVFSKVLFRRSPWIRLEKVVSATASDVLIVLFYLFIYFKHLCGSDPQIWSGSS